MRDTDARAGCPSPPELAAWLADGADGAHTEHILTCPRCEAAAEARSRHPDLDARLAAWAREGRDAAGAVAVALSRTPPPVGDISSLETAFPGEKTLGMEGSRRLGRYRLLRRVGEGGMGEVWEAEDAGLGRRVAVKLIRAESGRDRGLRERFLREARLLADASHPHVVPVYDQGEDGGELFLVMELLRGETLDARLTRESRLAIDEAVRVGREAASGLAHLHGRGLVHRDIKPGNLFLDGKGGHVRLLDFGLARQAAAGPTLTSPGAVLGTPSFMSPEQVRGEAAGERSDLFSLGCVLYRMLAGRSPFPGATSAEVMSQVLVREPEPLSRLRPEAPPALVSLVHRMLAKDAALRPASASEVADELARVRRDWPPRRPWWLAGAAALVIATAALAAFVVVKITHPDGKETTFKVQPGSIVEVGEKGEVTIVLPKDPKAPPKDVKAPPMEAAAVLDAGDRRGDVGSLAYSADGTRLLAAYTRGKVSWWDIAKGTEVAAAYSPSHEEGLYAGLAPDGKRLLTAGWHRKLLLWEPGQREPGAEFGRDIHSEVVLAPPVFLPDGKRVLVAHRDWHNGPSRVRLWSLAATPKATHEYKHAKYIRAVTLSIDGKRFATGCDDGVARVWSTEKEGELARFAVGRGEFAGSPFWSPTGPLVALGVYARKDPGPGTDPDRGRLRLFEMDGDEPKLVEAFDLGGAMFHGSWSGDGKRFAYALNNGKVVVRDMPSGKVAGEWTRPPGTSALGPVRLAPDGRLLAVGAGPAVRLLKLP